MPLYVTVRSGPTVEAAEAVAVISDQPTIRRMLREISRIAEEDEDRADVVRFPHVVATAEAEGRDV